MVMGKNFRLIYPCVVPLIGLISVMLRLVNQCTQFSGLYFIFCLKERREIHGYAYQEGSFVYLTLSHL